MSDKNNENPMESFPKPRTVPANWDVSAMKPAKKAARASNERAKMGMESFPEPRTIPDKWDTSDLSK